MWCVFYIWELLLCRLYVIYFLYIDIAITVYVQNWVEVQSDLAALLLFWHIMSIVIYCVYSCIICSTGYLILYNNQDLPWILLWQRVGAKAYLSSFTYCLKIPSSTPSFPFILADHSHFSPKNPGLIDLSEKITDIHYKEFICNDSYIDSYHNMQNILDSTQTRTTNLCANPCFATITPMHIDTWNHHCLHMNHTSYLLHYKHYDSIQGNHTEATVLANQYLTWLNSQLNMNTPRFDQYIRYKPGTTRQTYRFRHHLLPDGVHSNSRHHTKMGRNTTRYNIRQQNQTLLIHANMK